MPKRIKPALAVRFQIGDKVRVRHGVMDNDYPDMPIGGWSGTVLETHDGNTHVVRWSEETLASIHPVFKNRCENDGFDIEQYVIGADDLELDTGSPLNIDKPRKITARPLSPKDQDDRIRMIFGLTSNDMLPDVEDQALRTYYEHLSKHLVFPFHAEHGEEYGHPERVAVLGLGDAGEPMIDEMYGVLCEIRMGGRVVTLPLGELDDAKGKINRQLIDDYCYWFHNYA
jgi:calcium binding protein